MPNEKEREAIINAIRVLRSRRVRPSGQKISWYLKRQHFCDDEDTMQALDQLVRTGDITRVDYKGAMSYRVAKSRAIKSATPKTPALDGHAIRRAILSAVASCGPAGGSRYRIAACLQTRGLPKLVDRLDVILQREARVGVLTKKVVAPDKGKISTVYSIGTATKATDDECSSSDSEQPAITGKELAPFVHLQMQLELLKQKNGKALPRECDDASVKSGDKTPEYKPAVQEDLDKKTHPVPPKRGRPKKLAGEVKGTHPKRKGRPPSKRAKKEKKVYDPSEGGGAKKRQSGVTTRDTSPHSGDNCGVCNTNERDILCCNVCSTKAHPKCVGYGEELASKILKCPWTCMDCKSCSICKFNHRTGTLIFCDKCDRAFHQTCHSPPLAEFPQGAWVCFICIPQVQPNVYESLIPYLPTPVSSPERDEENSCESSENGEAKVPNVASWNVASVVEYFQNNGFERFAYVFEEQEIEGDSLLILSRDDVVNGFGLKLGPALKMFRQIRILQTRLACPPFL